MFETAPRNTGLSRSVTTKSSTPLKMAVKRTSLAELLIADIFTVNQPAPKKPEPFQTILEPFLRSPCGGRVEFAWLNLLANQVSPWWGFAGALPAARTALRQCGRLPMPPQLMQTRLKAAT